MFQVKNFLFNFFISAISLSIFNLDLSNIFSFLCVCVVADIYICRNVFIIIIYSILVFYMNVISIFCSF